MNRLVILLNIGMVLVAAAWPRAMVAAPGEHSEAGIVIELYRAILRLSPHDGSEIDVHSRLIDYDAFADSGLEEPTADMVRSPAPQVIVEKTPRGARIGSSTQREMIELTIKAPAATSIRIDIAHHGVILVDDMDAPIEINLFRGRVHLTGVRHGVSVDVRRDADVSIQCDRVDEREPLFVGSYDGLTQVSLPKAADVAVDARSHLGTVRNEDVPPADPSPATDRSPATIVLRNVRGDIAVTRR